MCSDEHHEHHLVLVEDADYGFTVRWCLDCGMLFRQLDGKTYAEMVPTWSRDKLEEMDRKKEVFKFMTEEQLRKKTSKKSENRLGRGLAALMKTEMPRSFPLFPSSTSETCSSSQKEITTTGATTDGSTSNTRSDPE